MMKRMCDLYADGNLRFIVTIVHCRFLCIPVIPTRRKVYLRNYWNTKKCQQHLTQTNLKIYWKIHCESTILDIYESKLAK